MFWDENDLTDILSDIERSIIVPLNFKDNMMTEDDIYTFTNDKKYSKYIIQGLENLSCMIIKVLHSGRGVFIVNYNYEYGINVSNEGFQNGDQLLQFAKYVVSMGDKILYKIKNSLYELKAIEDTYSIENIAAKNIDYLETEMKILANIHDFEKKAPYCEKLKTLITVQMQYSNLLEVYTLVYQVYLELVSLGKFN